MTNIPAPRSSAAGDSRRRESVMPAATSGTPARTTSVASACARRTAVPAPRRRAAPGAALTPRSRPRSPAITGAAKPAK
jgi:hypothetical protein